MQQKQIKKIQQELIHSEFAQKTDLANLQFDVDKLDIDKFKKIPSSLSNFKSKVDKLDVNKSLPAPVDLSELSDEVKNDVVKKDVYNAQIKNIGVKIPDITNLATNTTLNAKINEVKNRIPNITNSATTTALTAVENNMSDHIKSITTLEFNKLTTENFTARIKQANLATKRNIAGFVKKTDFDDKLKNQNKKLPQINRNMY